MTAVNESHLYKARRRLGVLEHVEVFRRLQSPPVVSMEALAKALTDVFRKAPPVFAGGVVPDFRAGRLRTTRSVWICVCVQMYGDKYICRCKVRPPNTVGEANVIVAVTGEYCANTLTLKEGLDLLYDSEGDVFLPMPGKHRPRIRATMAGVKRDKPTRPSGGRGSV